MRYNKVLRMNKRQKTYQMITVSFVITVINIQLAGGGVQNQMNKISGRQNDRKNQLSMDRDLNSIKTPIE